MIRGLLIAGLMVGCGGPGPAPKNLERLPDSMTRVEKMKTESKGGSGYRLNIMSTRADCKALIGDQFGSEQQLSMKDCLPRVEPGNGHVRLSYQIKDLNGAVVALPMQPDEAGRINPDNYIRVSQDGGQVLNDPNRGDRLALTPPGEASDAPQVFVLLVDRSSSMTTTDRTGKTRLGRLKEALRSRAVKDRFFASDNNRVLVLSFAQSVRHEGRNASDPGGENGVSWELISSKNRDRYDAVIGGLSADGGYTHMYDSLDEVLSKHLKRKEIHDYLVENQALPTVILLTDGFNNKGPQDTCGSNARPLKKLISKINKTRRSSDLKEPVLSPVVFTVGLGKPALKSFPYLDKDYEDPKQKTDAINKKLRKAPTPDLLCGKDAGVLINKNRRDPNRLENRGIDNASLQWIANRGGGRHVITEDIAELSKAFQDAAVQRYDWFHVYYQVDPALFRQSFQVTVETRGFVESKASVRFHPPTAFDFPESDLAKAEWMGASVPFRSTTALVLPFLGICISLVFLGAAMFNLRRALMREQPRDNTPSS